MWSESIGNYVLILTLNFKLGIFKEKSIAEIISEPQKVLEKC